MRTIKKWSPSTLCRREKRPAMSASLIGRSGSSAFRLSTTAMSMSLTGSRFSSESAPRPLYGAFVVKKFKQGGAFSSSAKARLVRSG